MSKKPYPDEFKVEAAKQVVDCGHSVADVAGYLGMTTHSLYAWIKKFGPDFAKHNAMSGEQAESAKWPVRALCDLFDVHPCGYYA